MDENCYKSAIFALCSGEYCSDDIRVVKDHLNQLNQQELKVKRRMERETCEFVKNKRKNQSELRNLRTSIKEVRNLLKCV